MKDFEVLIKNNKQYLPVGNKKAVLYGTSSFFLSQIRMLQLPDIAYSVSESEDNVGKTLFILGREYEIHSHEFLRELSTDEYYVVSEDPKIKWGGVLCVSDQIVYQWDSLYDLFYNDPRILSQNVEHENYSVELPLIEQFFHERIKARKNQSFISDASRGSLKFHYGNGKGLHTFESYMSPQRLSSLHLHLLLSKGWRRPGDRVILYKKRLMILSEEEMQGKKNSFGMCLSNGFRMISFLCRCAMKRVFRSKYPEVIYDSLEQLMETDRRFRYLFAKGGFSFRRDSYLREFRKALEESGIKNCERFTSAETGANSTVIFFQSEGKEYVYRRKPEYCGIVTEKQTVRNTQISDYLKKYTDYTVYADKKGVWIAKRGKSKIDFFDRTVQKRVLNAIWKFHQNHAEIDLHYSLEDRWNAEFSRLSGKYGLSKEHIDDLKKVFSPLLDYLSKHSEEKLCHGDLHPGNILEIDGKICFIDLDGVGYRDPMSDLSYFLYYLEMGKISGKHRTKGLLFESQMSVFFDRLPDFLADYSGDTNVSNEDVLSLHAWCILWELFRGGSQAAYPGRKYKKLWASIEKHVKNWMIRAGIGAQAK